MDARNMARGASQASLDTPPALLIPPTITDEDLAALTRAVAALTQATLASRFNAVLGRQIDLAAQIVPAPVLSAVNRATVAALRIALRTAIRSLRGRQGPRTARPRLHIAAAALSGAAGGAFGLSALPVELPVSTTIMLRSIAEIAQSEGENLAEPESMLACLEVFALGSGSDNGPAGESGYLAMRSVLAKSITEAARYVVQRGMAEEAAPAIVRLMSQIASRFGVAVGQKAMTQALPVIGALTGAAINAAFTDHFQGIARGHFTVRRLERRYGAEPIRALFEDLKARGAAPDQPTATAEMLAVT